MKKNQLKLNEMWGKNEVVPGHVPSTVKNEPEILSTTPSSSSTFSQPSLPIAFSSPTFLSASLLPIKAEELLLEVNVVEKNSCNDTRNFLSDHDYNLSNADKNAAKKNLTSRSKHRTHYLIEWEKRLEAQYKTYVFDDFGGRHETFTCWLYLKDNSMGCHLCEKYEKRKNSNGKENLWCTTGMKTFSLDKIKLHKEKSGVHKQAEQQELLVSSRSQLRWITTQEKQLNEHDLAIQNFMMTCIYLCQQDHSLNSIGPLCDLLEKLGVQLLQTEVSGVNYRNSTAALCFIQHIASYLHEELIEKVKKSPVCGWMMDASTSRTTEKTCIIYVRYIEDNEIKTDYYGLLNLEGDGTSNNIVKCLLRLWNKDNLKPYHSCWLSTDNASTVTDAHEGVTAKLCDYLAIDHLELNACVAHSFALVGAQSCYLPKIQKNDPHVLSDSIMKLESTISKIYNYFNNSCTTQFKLKCWRNFLECPQLKFQNIFNISWCSIRDCIKPIVVNIQPGSQSLFGCLQESMFDCNLSNSEREHAKDLLNTILDDEFLFLIHMHHDLHEFVLNPVTKIMQNEHLTYFSLMEMIKEKTNVLKCWTFQSSFANGPSLFNYIESTKNGIFGAFKIKLGDRQKFSNDCRDHIGRLLEELAERFSPSIVQENLSILFDPQYLNQHKNDIGSTEYGRGAIDFLRKKYKNFVGFDSFSVRNEWECLKAALSDYINNHPIDYTVKGFWKSFLLLKQATYSVFHDLHKNILLLLYIYLISPTNSVECERGFSAINRVHTIGRSRVMISTLDAVMTVRMLLKDDLRSSRCQQVVDNAFESWNDRDFNRRFHQIQLLIDTSDDYEPTKQIRSTTKRSITSIHPEIMHKKPKTKSIKCANGCNTEVSRVDRVQNKAIQCCHQSEQFNWIDYNRNCSRWLCNKCSIELGTSIDCLWFCCDHEDMHDDEEENQENWLHW